MKHLQKPDCKQTSPYLCMVIRSVCLLIAQLDTQVLPIVSTIECRVVIDIKDVVQSLLKTCLYDACSLTLAEQHTNQI
jgi:hypothetical protein